MRDRLPRIFQQIAGLRINDSRDLPTLIRFALLARGTLGYHMG